MIPNNMRRAQAAASAGTYAVNSISFSNLTDQYGNYDFESDQYAVEGNTLPVQLAVSYTNQIEVEIGYIRVVRWVSNAWDYDNAEYLSVAAFNAKTHAVGKFGITFGITRFGIQSLPQSTTITVRNTSDNNAIVGSFTATWNPEPA